MIKIAIILGSTRPGRNGEAVAKWVYEVAQYTRFAGVEGEPQDGIHFCGEHTSIDPQGYLEGAVETGERAAIEVISALR